MTSQASPTTTILFWFESSWFVSNTSSRHLVVWIFFAYDGYQYTATYTWGTSILVWSGATYSVQFHFSLAIHSVTSTPRFVCWLIHVVIARSIIGIRYILWHEPRSLVHAVFYILIKISTYPCTHFRLNSYASGPILFHFIRFFKLLHIVKIIFLSNVIPSNTRWYSRCDLIY